MVNDILIGIFFFLLQKNFSNTKLPILIVASKTDLTAVKQDYHMQPDEFCTFYKLTPLHKFSHSDNENSINTSEVYEKLGTMATYPNLNRLVHLLLMKPSNSWMSQNIKYIVAYLLLFFNTFIYSILQRCFPDRIAVLQAGIGFASLAILGLFILRFLRSNTSNSH